ncbi:LINE-1 retrotransposable element ORF1 protein, partial [Elysia marginata]
MALKLLKGAKRQGVHDTNKERATFGEYHHLFAQLKQDPDRFQAYTGMSIGASQYILNKVENRLVKNWTNWHRPIFPEERLVVTLRNKSNRMPNSKRKKQQSDDSHEISQIDLFYKLELLEGKIEKISNLNTQKVLDEIEQLRGSLHDLQTKQQEMEKEIKHLKEERTILVDEVQELRNTVNVTNSKQNQTEQYLRKNNLRFFGVTDNKNERAEETFKLVSEINKKKLNLTQFSGLDIDKAHRVGNFHANTDRAIIARFTTHRAAELVLANRRALKGSKIVIAEDLTAETLQLFRKVKEMDRVQQ